MSLVDHKDEAFPPIVVLIVEERAYAADQFAQLLRLWGVTATHHLPRFQDVVAYLKKHPAPALMLLDHSLHSHTCVEIGLWLAARPPLRQRLCLVSYTNAEEREIQQRLRDHIDRLRHDPLLDERLLGPIGTTMRVELDQLISTALINEQAFESMYYRIYDAHLSKRLSIRAARLALLRLAHTIPRTI